MSPEGAQIHLRCTVNFAFGPRSGYEVENEFFRFFLAPSDGGRILSLFDKRLGKDIVYCSKVHRGLLDDRTQNTLAPYEAEIAEQSTGKLSISLSHSNPHFGMEYGKTITVYEQRPVIEDTRHH